MTQERIDKLQELLGKREKLQREIKKLEAVLKHDRNCLHIDIGINDTRDTHLCTLTALPPAVFDGFAKTLKLLTAELRGVQKEIDKF